MNLNIIFDFKINNLNKKRLATPCIINGWFLPTYENPRGFYIWCLFAKLVA